MEGSNQNQLQSEQKIHSHKRGQRRYIRRIVSFILSILLTMDLVLLLGMAGLSIGTFRTEIIPKELQENQYYQQVYQTIRKQSEEILKGVKLPTSLLDTVLTEKDVYLDGKKYVEASLEGKDLPVDAAAVGRKLDRAIAAYLTKNHTKITKDVQVSMDTITKTMESEYSRLMNFGFARSFYEYQQLYSNMARVLIPVMTGLALLLACFIVLIQNHKHKGFRYLAYSDLSAAVLLASTARYLLAAKCYIVDSAKPKYYQDFLAGYLKWDISVYAYLAIVGLVVFVILLAVVGFLKRKMLS